MAEKTNSIISKIKSEMKEGWLFISTIVIFGILIFNPIAEKLAFIPDWLNLEKLKPKEYFGLIIGAIASIFGILMAVVLLTVEFFKERLSKNKHINPLDNNLIRNSIYSSVNLIGLSFIAYIFIDHFQNSKNLTIGYFLGIIFIAYIYSVFPVLKRIIGKSSRIKNNIDLVNTLNLVSFKTVSRYRHTNPNETNETLRILKKEIDSYILSSNISAYEKINDDVFKKVLEFIGNGDDRNNCDIIVNGIVWLWEENCMTAIRVNDSQYFELLWSYIEELFLYFANKKAPLLHLQDLNFFIIFNFLEYHIALGNGIALTRALDKVENSVKANLLHNCPKQDNLKDLIRLYEGGEFIETNFQDSTQWDAINSIFGFFAYIQKAAITLADKNLFEASIRRHQDICSDIFYNDFRIENYQKGYIFWRQLTSSFYSSSLALESKLYSDTRDCFRVPKYLIDRIVERNEIDEKDIRAVMTHLADYLIIAFKNGSLSTDQHFGTLDEYSIIGIQLIKHYKTHKTARKTVNYIIKFLKKIKGIAEDDLSMVNPNHYLAIKKKIKHFIDVATDNDSFDENEKPITKWKKIYNNFKEVDENKDFGLIKW